jgi:hypothetical protein
MNPQAWLFFSITDGSEGSTDYSCLRTIGHGFCFPRVPDSDNPCGDQGRWRSSNSHHSNSNLPQRLVIVVKGFQRRAPMGIPPLVQLASQRPRLGLTPVLRVVSQVISHCFLSRKIKHISTRIQVGIGCHLSSRRFLVVVERYKASSIAPNYSSIHASIVHSPAEFRMWQSR